MIGILLFFISFLVSYFGVAIFIRLSSKHGLVDIPNDRSSHETPTPRGGGLVIVVISLFAYYIICTYLNHNISWGYIFGVSIIALVSCVDDIYSVPVIFRFLIHSIAAYLAVADLTYWNEINIAITGSTFHLGSLGFVVTFLWVVWMINAFNFMDGIDGIAGLQAIITSSGWLVFSLIFGYWTIYLFSGVLLFAVFGFLIHNWSPAKIFMGDVGSSFLGFTFAVIPLIALKEKPESSLITLVIAIAFVWLFLFDTIVTFGIRLFSGKKFWNAHREHIYQKLVISGLSHSVITILYGVIAVLISIAGLAFAFFGGIFGYILICMIIVTTSALLIVNSRKNALTLRVKKC